MASVISDLKKVLTLFGICSIFILPFVLSSGCIALETGEVMIEVSYPGEWSGYYMWYGFGLQSKGMKLVNGTGTQYFTIKNPRTVTVLFQKLDVDLDSQNLDVNSTALSNATLSVKLYHNGELIESKATDEPMGMLTITHDFMPIWLPLILVMGVAWFIFGPFTAFLIAKHAARLKRNWFIWFFTVCIFSIFGMFAYFIWYRPISAKYRHKSRKKALGVEKELLPPTLTAGELQTSGVSIECPWCHQRFNIEKDSHTKRAECPYCGGIAQLK